MAKGFRIAARALRQLGAELITSDDIALYELIKNSFDARSPRVRITINAPLNMAGLNRIAEELSARTIKPHDALKQIDSLQLKQPIDSNTTKIISDLKLSAGSRDSLLKSLQDFINQHFWIEIQDDGIGMSKENLEDAFLVVGTPCKWIIKKENPSDPFRTLGDKGVGRLSMMRLGKYATVKSTCKNETAWHSVQFDWQQFDDPRLFLEDIEVTVNPIAEIKPDPVIRGTSIKIYGLISNWTEEKVTSFINLFVRRLQNPFNKGRRRFPIDVIFNNTRLPIPGMHEWFQKCANFSATFKFDPAKDIMLRRTLRWRDSSSDDIRDWDTKNIMGLLDVPLSTLRRLGPFEMSCLWFNRQQITPKTLEVSPSQVKAELNLWCGGFAIYRDDFRVGMTGGLQDDWLEMDKKSLKTQGYALNRYQTVGAVTLSSSMNEYLTDAANRERLISCPEYDVLKVILGEIAIQDLRMHINVMKETEAKVAISEEVTEGAILRSKNQLSDIMKTLQQLKKLVPSDVKEALSDVSQSLKTHLEDIRRFERAVDLAKETRTEILELAGVGLVVEIVIHELARLTANTLELLSGLQNGGSPKEVANLVEILKQQIKATNKRIRTVDALSPAGRHRKGEFDLVAFTKSVLEGYNSRFIRHDIKSIILLDGEPAKKPFKVNMVMGLLAQVLENLITNSVYWLKQGLMFGETERKITINFDTTAQTMYIKDNGPGIEPSYVKQIFNPYFTTRPRGKGLGLFIAREIAAYHGANFYLDETPDSDNRLREFVLEIPRSL